MVGFFEEEGLGRGEGERGGGGKDKGGIGVVAGVVVPEGELVLLIIAIVSSRF